MNKIKKAIDPEMAEFEAALLNSISQSAKGEGRMTSPAQIKARRVGRPVGTLKDRPKVSTTIRLSPDVVEAFKASGGGWQTKIDLALKDWLKGHKVT